MIPRRLMTRSCVVFTLISGDIVTLSSRIEYVGWSITEADMVCVGKNGLEMLRHCLEP